MSKGKIIKSLREKHEMTQDQLAEKLGTTKQTVFKYENDIITNIPSDKVELMAEIFSVSPAYIMGWDEPVHKTIKGIRIPVLGHVRAGIPIDAYEDILDYEEITPSMALDGEYFGLQVKGDSMEPKFSEGDVVIVRKQEDAECGDIIIALVNGDEATIKKLIKYEGGGIALVASNPLYAPMHFTEEDIATKPVAIIGKVVELRAKF